MWSSGRAHTEGAVQLVEEDDPVLHVDGLGGELDVCDCDIDGDL